MVVVGECGFTGRDANDGHAELLGAERHSDVPSFGAKFWRHGGERHVIRLGDVKNWRIGLWAAHDCESVTRRE